MDSLANDSIFAWQGCEAAVPETWELERGAYGGDATAGYACLDDGVRMRLRVRWDRRARGESSVEAALNRYRRTVEKAGKSQVSFSLLDPEALPARFRKDKHAKPFRWEGADIGFGAVWYCPGCGSVVVLEVVFAAEKDDPKTAKQIIAGARCHRDDAERLWSVYGFAFRTPDSYNLSKPELQSGRLAFSFNGPDRSWLVVERWGLARQVLSRAPMEVWPQEWLKLRKLYPAQTHPSGVSRSRRPTPASGLRRRPGPKGFGRGWVRLALSKGWSGTGRRRTKSWP